MARGRSLRVRAELYEQEGVTAWAAFRSEMPVDALKRLGAPHTPKNKRRG